MFYFRCPGCQSVLSLDDNCAGMKACCPKCQQAMMLPATKKSRSIFVGTPGIRTLLGLNWWKKSAIFCWLTGATLILVPATLVAIAYKYPGMPINISVQVAALLAGIVLAAFGNTLNALGTGRE